MGGGTQRQQMSCGERIGWASDSTGTRTRKEVRLQGAWPCSRRLYACVAMGRAGYEAEAGAGGRSI